MRVASVVVIVIVVAVLGSRGYGQEVGAQEVGAAFAVDSLHVSESSVDSLSRLDSIVWAKLKAQDERLMSLKQVASQRQIDLTNDGKPEILRLAGSVNLADPAATMLTLTIRHGGKTLYSDTWKAGDYFDPIDHLSDTAMLRRLHRYVTVVFANENFTVLDSSGYDKVLADRSAAEIQPGSPQSKELIAKPRVMFNVFAGLDRLYGISWLPSKKRFVKVWEN
jgi:hypothetical protein